MLKITQHDLKICIKHNLGFDQVCEKYQCSRDELERTIDILYESRNAEKTRKELQRNSRNVAKAIRKSAKNRCEMRALEESHLTPLEECHEQPSLSRLGQLKVEEDSLSKAVMKSESEHKTLVNKHRSNIKELHRLSSSMDALKAQFETINAKYEQCVISNNALVDQINAVTERRHEQLTQLQAVRAEIETLTVIPVCVYADGRIEPLDDADVTLDDTGSDQLYQDIISQKLGQCQDLRLRDLKTASRIQAIIKNSTCKFDFLFEDATLENYCLGFN